MRGRPSARFAVTQRRVNSGSVQVLGQCGGGAAGALAAADLLLGLRWLPRRRAGNANVSLGAAAEPQPSFLNDTASTEIYTLNPVLWREDGAVRRAPAFALVELPKCLLPLALRHQHVYYLNARRVQTLIHVHGSEGANSEPSPDDPQLVDLDALAAQNESVEAVVA